MTPSEHEDLRLVVDKLGEIRGVEERREAKVEVQRVRNAVRALILEHHVRLSDRRDNRRRNRIDGLDEFDVMSIYGLSASLVRITGVSDLQAKLIQSTTKEVFRRIPVLVNSVENLSNRVDRDGDSVGESHDILARSEVEEARLVLAASNNNEASKYRQLP